MVAHPSGPIKKKKRKTKRATARRYRNEFRGPDARGVDRRTDSVAAMSEIDVVDAASGTGGRAKRRWPIPHTLRTGVDQGPYPISGASGRASGRASAANTHGRSETHNIHDVPRRATEGLDPIKEKKKKEQKSRLSRSKPSEWPSTRQTQLLSWSGPDPSHDPVRSDQ